MKGKLYAHVRDENRFMLVQLDSQFPSDLYDLNAWRLVDIGVKPPDTSIADNLRRDGYCEFRK